MLHPVGSFVFEGMVLVEFDADDIDDACAADMRHAIVIGDSRTMQQDVSCGITRLVDIGLRALSPGVNDPNTAREVMLRLGQILLRLMEADLTTDRNASPGRVEWLGRNLHSDYVTEAFEQMLEAAVGSPTVLSNLIDVATTVLEGCRRRELRGDTSGLERLIGRADRAREDGSFNGRAVPSL